MRPIDWFHRVLSDSEVEQLYEGALALLADPGMRLENEAMLRTLERKGGAVDRDAQVVRFPRAMVEETVARAQVEEQERRLQAAGSGAAAAAASRGAGGVAAPGTRSAPSETSYLDQLTFSWHTPFHERVPPVQASFGGGAPLYYDHEARVNRYATGRTSCAWSNWPRVSRRS